MQKWNCFSLHYPKRSGRRHSIIRTCVATIWLLHAKICYLRLLIMPVTIEGKSHLSSVNSVKKEFRSIIFISKNKTAEKFSAVFVSIDDDIQFSSRRIDHQTVDRNIRIQQRMVANHVDTVGDTFFNIIEAAEPAFQINSGILHHIDGLLVHAPFFNLLDHFMWFNIRHAAIVMSNNVDFVCIQFIYGYQQTAHNAAEWVIDD